MKLINEKYIENIAMEFFVSALNDDGERAHELAHVIIDNGPESSHNFVASMFFLIKVFQRFITKKYPGSNTIIKKLCRELRDGKSTKKCERDDLQTLESHNRFTKGSSLTNKKKSNKDLEIDDFYRLLNIRSENDVDEEEYR